MGTSRLSISHDHIIDAEADECGKQVFGSRDQYALAHQRGGVADFGDVAASGGNFVVVEVGAAEDDTRTGGRGDAAQVDFSTGVQTHTAKLQRFLDRVLELGAGFQTDVSRQRINASVHPRAEVRGVARIDTRHARGGSRTSRGNPTSFHRRDSGRERGGAVTWAA